MAWRKNKDGTRSLVVTLSLPEEIGLVIEELRKTSLERRSTICRKAIARGLSGRSRATTLEGLIREIAATHTAMHGPQAKKALAQQLAEDDALLEGETVAGALLRRRRLAT